MSIKRRQLMQYGAISLGSGLITACGSPPQPPALTRELTKVTFGTNWFAQAEHGGFYQAVATGIYRDHGLDVKIQMGGPQVNGTQLLLGGVVDFYMGFSADALQAVEAGIPKVTVAAIFQKDPQVLMAHPNTGATSLAALKGRPIFVSAIANVTYWPFLVAKYGFTETMKRPYNFNLSAFLADKNSVQQGYLTSEPLAIEQQGGFKPVIFLLADQGYNPYATTIETKQALVETNPDLVQRFVDASIKGWYSYLEGDPAPGNALIKQANPQMQDAQIAYGLAQSKANGIVISGDAIPLGIGAMTDSHWQSFFQLIADQGIVKPNTDYHRAYTLQFVNKGRLQPR
ncbi:nitrate ABC transporter substrate-binding protein [Neosynechococcus sphagnicola sy1]|uniref:Nitrate ABC transporter substrate-binding protein n=1 Tax=Neosynechococcus sphagnicola sy1 TaxID=1497020 RepID=A0A098THM7_9CYAN|nr:ABC transporter substrate-binding protein [Neosynechococcus sphagnicola]KGF71579.1 nitrate ABC transporter substrate-binding protein [Neosynechococcus sphagnicola sy1]